MSMLSKEHISLLGFIWDSYLHWTNKTLLPHIVSGNQASALHAAPFGLLCHDGAPDPLFTYANLNAQKLFDRCLMDFIGLPSRLSAESVMQGARHSKLQEALHNGIITDYSGVRVSATGRRFFIQNVSIWNVKDDLGTLIGQAAMIPHWDYLETTQY
jgi:hypothetical protein